MEPETTWKVLKHRCSDLNQLILSECQLQQRLEQALKVRSAHHDCPPLPRALTHSGSSLALTTREIAVGHHLQYNNQLTQTEQSPSQSVQTQTEPPQNPVSISPVDSIRPSRSTLKPPRIRCHARSSSIDFLGALTGFQPGPTQSVPFYRNGCLNRDPLRNLETGPGHVFLPATRIRRGSWAWGPAHTYTSWPGRTHPPKDPMSGTPTRQESRARIKAQSRAWRKETQALKRQAEPEWIASEDVSKKIKSPRTTMSSPEKVQTNYKRAKTSLPNQSRLTAEESNDSQSEWETNATRNEKPIGNGSRFKRKTTSETHDKRVKSSSIKKSNDLFSPSSNTDFDSESVSSPEKPPTKFKSQAFVVSSSSSNDHSDSEPEEIQEQVINGNTTKNRPEKHTINEKELIPLGTDKSKLVKKPLDISSLRKKLEASAVVAKKPATKVEPKPSRQFGRLPASLLKTKEACVGTPIASENSHPPVSIDLEEGARYETLAPRKRISLLSHKKLDSSSRDSGSSSVSQDEKPEKIRKITVKPPEQKAEGGESDFQKQILDRIDREGPLKLERLYDFGPLLERIPSPDYRPSSPQELEESSHHEPSIVKGKPVNPQCDDSTKVVEDSNTDRAGTFTNFVTYKSVPPPNSDDSPQTVPDLKSPPPTKTKNHLIGQPPENLGGILKIPQPNFDKSEDSQGSLGEDPTQNVPQGANLFDSPPPPIPKKDSRSPNVNMMEVVLQGKTFLEHSYHLYSMGHRMKAQVLEQRSKILKSRDLERELHINLVQAQLGRLWKSKDKITFENVVKQLSRPEFAPNGNSMRVLFNRITYEIMSERKEDPLLDPSRVPPNVPISTAKQIKILSLLASLKEQEGFQSIFEEFVDHLSYYIFAKSRLFMMSLYQACFLIRFYVILLRIGGLEERCRLLIYDTFFFKSTRNHVFILTIIEVWPEILQWTGLVQNEIILDPILEAMVWMVYNTGPSGLEVDLKIYDARNAMKNVCRLPNPECSAIDMIKKFLRIGLQSKDKPDLLDSLNRAILLISRSQDYLWNHNNLIRPLLELLGKTCQDDEDESQTLLCWAIEAIGLTSRCYPAVARKHLEHIFEALVKLLDSPKLNARGESICLLALLRVGHHLQLQIAKFFVKWKPRHVIGLDVAEIVSNFVGTRAKKFTTKTIEISQNTQNNVRFKRKL